MKDILLNCHNVTIEAFLNTSISIGFTQIKSDITFRSQHLKKSACYRNMPRVFS